MPTLEEEVIAIAHRSPLGRYKTGALLIRDDEILSTGWSHVGSIRHASTYSVHAEMHALMRARHLDLEGAICMTITTRGMRAFAALPCANCARALTKAGIEAVITDNIRYYLPTGHSASYVLKSYARPDAN